MYSLADYEPYTLQKSLLTQPVLAWSRKNGYHFLSMPDRLKAMANREDFKIIAIKENYDAT